jgi:hypothetical protein
MANEIEPVDDDLGPAMQACLPKERAFVAVIFQNKSAALSAKEAGYGVEGSTAETLAKIGYRLLHRDRVQAALIEYMKKEGTTLVPQAIQTLKHAMTQAALNPAVAAKVALAVIERAAPTVQKIDAQVTHTVVDRRNDLVEALRTAKRFGASREKLIELFGYSELPALEKQLAIEDGNIVDAEFTELPGAIDPEVLEL